MSSSSRSFEPAPQQLTGIDESALVLLADGHRLLTPVAEAFCRLQKKAALDGFELAIASSFRSFGRQLAIFNGKASGCRPVHDDRGRAVAMTELDGLGQLQAILRYSALPGASRHHWGTDLDIYDAAAIPADYSVQLVPEEVADTGFFGPLHCWLDERMAAGESEGFYRPYGEDKGGVAPERWHLSYASVASVYEQRWTADVLLDCWRSILVPGELLLQDIIEEHLPVLIRRYVEVAPGWCPVPLR
ncbi:MAG: M15 family metallopeptidase [Parahaliea sp.]